MKLGHEIHYESDQERWENMKSRFSQTLSDEERFEIGRALTAEMYDWDKKNNPKGIFGNRLAPWVYGSFPPVGGS